MAWAESFPVYNVCSHTAGGRSEVLERLTHQAALSKGTSGWGLVAKSDAFFTSGEKLRGTLACVREVDIRNVFARGLGVTSFHAQEES